MISSSTCGSTASLDVRECSVALAPLHTPFLVAAEVMFAVRYTGALATKNPVKRLSSVKVVPPTMFSFVDSGDFGAEHLIIVHSLMLLLEILYHGN